MFDVGRGPHRSDGALSSPRSNQLASLTLNAPFSQRREQE
jgi:hypothetical protein